MKQPDAGKPRKKKKKTPLLSRLASGFAGASMLALSGMGGTVLVHHAIEAEKAFNAAARDPFIQINRVIAQLERGDIAEMPLFAIARDGYLRERRYRTSYAFEADGRYDVIPRLKWDLRMLGYFDGAGDNRFTGETEEAVRAFQKDFNIPSDEQTDARGRKIIDERTMQAIGEESYRQRMMIGLHAWKTAISENIQLEDLLRLIALEASFNPHAGAKTSSAVGLGQFVRWTWMEVIRDNGADFGLRTQAHMARDILRSKDRGHELSNFQKSQMDAILDLRRDYRIAIPMIARYAKKSLGNRPFSVEVAYPIYVLGPNGEKTALEQPGRIGRDVMPAVAEANKRFFFAWEPAKDKKGRIRRDAKGFQIMDWGTPYTLEVAYQNIRNRTTEPALLEEVRGTAGIVRSLSINLQPENWVMPAPGAGMTARIELK